LLRLGRGEKEENMKFCVVVSLLSWEKRSISLIGLKEDKKMVKIQTPAIMRRGGNQGE